MEEKLPTKEKKSESEERERRQNDSECRLKQSLEDSNSAVKLQLKKQAIEENQNSCLRNKTQL
jgi:hypothetical protein